MMPHRARECGCGVSGAKTGNVGWRQGRSALGRDPTTKPSDGGNTFFLQAVREVLGLPLAQGRG